MPACLNVCGSCFDRSYAKPSVNSLNNKTYSRHHLLRQVTLENGMVVFLMEDHEVPLIKGTMLIKGGAQADPSEKVM